jgi:uncharacterized protein (TIGR02246 family)
MASVLFVLLALAGPAPQADRAIPADARAAIDKANSDWIPALEAHDAVRIAAAYADEGVFVMPDGSVVKGRDAVAQLYRDRFARMGTIVRGGIVQDGLTRQGSMIYEWGHADLELAHDGAAPTHSRGRYLTVWQKNAVGRWVITRNLSLPE